MSRRVRLQMVSLGLMILFSSDGSARCFGPEELRSRVAKFEKYRATVKVTSALRDTDTCAQVAKKVHKDLSGRALSPWRLRLDQDLNRFPQHIAVAQCLCHGCIINQRENSSFNSVPVFTQLMVLHKSQCPWDRDKFVLRQITIRVPVACTCAVPRYTSAS